MTLTIEGKKSWKAQRRQQKYGNVRVTTDEGTFDSKREYTRWCVLKLMQKAKEISGLEHHVEYPFALNGVYIGCYEADFVYFRDGVRIVEDSKGVQTALFKWKAKMMRAFYNIVVEIS